MNIDYKKQGKRNLAAGRLFELKTRKDLELKGWIVSRWQNNIEWLSDNLKNNDFGNKEVALGKCIQAKQGKFRKTSTGFPDFIIYKEKPISNLMTYEVIFVECKSNSYLSKEEKEKARFYLENRYCSKFLIASKYKEKGRIKIKYEDFYDKYSKSIKNCISK